MPVDAYLIQWLQAFGATCLIEGAVVTWALRRYGVVRAAALALLAQLVTHPAVWFIWPRLGLPRAEFLAVAESWAFLAEAVFYTTACWGLGWRRAVLLSAVANGASWLGGTLLQLLHWL